MSTRTLRNSLLLVLLLSGALMISYPYLPGVSAQVKAAKDRKAAPDFVLKDGHGMDVKLSDYKGQVVLLNFWATWCGPCKIEIPWFSEFEAKFKSRGFAVLGVSMDEDGWAAVKPYIEKMKMSYRVVVGDDGLAQKYGGVESLPTTLLIDRNGKIASAHTGLVGKGTYEKEITELLDK